MTDSGMPFNHIKCYKCNLYPCVCTKIINQPMTADEAHEILTKLYDKGFSIVENSEIESAKIQSLKSQLDQLRKENEGLKEKEIRSDRQLVKLHHKSNVLKYHAEEMAKAIENTLNGQFFPAELQQALTNFREGNK